MPLRPVLAVDVVLLCVEHGGLRVLLHPRREAPFKGAQALPGVALEADESLLQAAQRALVSKTGLAPDQLEALHLEQLAVFDGPYRDPRGRTVSAAHLGLCPAPPELAPGAGGVLREVQAALAGGLPFDHAEVLQAALARLRGKLRYTNIAAFLLPEAFRIDALQAVYEAVLGRRLNRANFRTKLLRIGLIEQAGILAGAVGQQGGRPPHVYRFAREELEAVDRDFL